VLADIYDKNTKELISTMHHLSTENNPLKLRCQGLESALEKRQRGKALQFDIPPPEKGDAVFYCLRKVEQARDLQRMKLYSSLKLQRGRKGSPAASKGRETTLA
jgi:hypothetical protein